MDPTNSDSNSNRYYGPFYRLHSTTQTEKVAELQVQSQEVWGRPRRFSDIPQVQAYVGPLPATNDGDKDDDDDALVQGIEFLTRVPPDKDQPPGQARWTGPRQGVTVQDDFAKIPVLITKNTQSSSTQQTSQNNEEENILMAA